MQISYPLLISAHLETKGNTMPIYTQEEKPRLPQCGTSESPSSTPRSSAKRPPSFSSSQRSTANHRSQQQEHLSIPPKQMKFISDTMKDIREEEMTHRRSSAAIKKRKRISRAVDNWTSFFLDSLSCNRNVPQIVATTGGLVTCCKILHSECHPRCFFNS